MELIETYMEEHTQVWTPRKSRQLDVMVEDLRAQFQKMETAWDTMREDVDRGTAYDGVEAKVNAAEASMLQAIRQAEEFQEEKEKKCLGGGKPDSQEPGFRAGGTAPGRERAGTDSSRHSGNSGGRSTCKEFKTRHGTQTQK